MKLFIAPHNDDEALFGAFSILRDRPLVLIVTDSARQASKGITADERRKETLAAMNILGAKVEFLGIPDAALNAGNFLGQIREFLEAFGPLDHIYSPAFELNGNVDHNVIAGVGLTGPVTRYLTYTTHGKSRSAVEVPFEKDWPLLKLKALACYESQLREPSTRYHFLRSQLEYYQA